MLTKRASRSACGVYDCSACDLYRQEKCPGCASGNLHLLRDGAAPCVVYACVRAVGVGGCHECRKPACKLGGWSPSRCPLRGRFGGEAEYEAFRRMLDDTRGLAAHRAGNGLPARAAQRMSSYLRVAEEYATRGVATVSSHQLARAAGVRSSLVRRDLSELGRCGTPGRGYQVDALQRAIRSRLRLEDAQPTVWLGAPGILNHESTRRALELVGCKLVGVFDDDWRGGSAAGLRVQRLSKATERAKREQATVAVLAAAKAASPEMVQQLGAAGVKAVLNLTPARLTASASLTVEQGDLATLLLRLLCRLRPPAEVERPSSARKRRKP